MVTLDEQERYIQLVAVRSHEDPVLLIGSIQAKPSSQLFRQLIGARVVTHVCVCHGLLVLCEVQEECPFKVGVLTTTNKPFGKFGETVKGEVPEEWHLDHEVGAGCTGERAVQYRDPSRFGQVKASIRIRDHATHIMANHVGIFQSKLAGQFVKIMSLCLCIIVGSRRFGLSDAS